jgi:putative transposase
MENTSLALEGKENKETLNKSYMCVPDHVHVFLRAEPTISPNRIIAGLKGYTSRVLRREFVELRSKLPTLWSSVSTHGYVSTETIEKYIEEQQMRG